MRTKLECPSCEFTSNESNTCPYCILTMVEPSFFTVDAGPISQPIQTTLSDRKNDGKLRMDLVPPSAVISIAEVLTKGLEKYDENNWMKGNWYSVPYASLLRHLMAWKSGEDLDPETGLSHLKHIIMNAVMLDYYEQNYEHLDDRSKR